MADDKYWREFEELKKALAAYLKDVQRLRRRDDLLISAITSAIVTTIFYLLIC